MCEKPPLFRLYNEDYLDMRKDVTGITEKTSRFIPKSRNLYIDLTCTQYYFKYGIHSDTDSVFPSINDFFVTNQDQLIKLTFVLAVLNASVSILASLPFALKFKLRMLNRQFFNEIYK